ncbi:MAG: DMT family transporter [Chloroflexota bacterium]
MPTTTQPQALPKANPHPRTAAIRRRMQSTRVRAYAALALGAICIGFSAIFTKWSGIPGPVSAFYRVLIATAALAIPYAWQVYRQRSRERILGIGTKRSKLTPALLGMTALAGFFFAADLASWNTSLQYTSAANSTLMGNLSTIWVSLGALFIFHESLKRRFWTGMAIAVAGVVIVVGRDAFEHPHLGWGDLIAVGSSLFYAGYLLTTGRTRQQMGTLTFMWLNSVAATIILAIYVFVTNQTLTGFSADTWWSLIALGLISHALGWLSINYSLGHLPAPLTAVTLLLQPVITALLAVPLLGEGLSVYQIAGGLLVLLGIYTVNRR